MIPVEAFFAFLLGLFGFIGLARKFPLELGATIGFSAMLFSLLLVDGVLAKVATRLASMAGIHASDSLVHWLAITGYILMWVFFMYVGQTLTFAGAWPPGRLVGVILDTAIGVFNGWLVVGTWWFYSHTLGYPMQALGWFMPPLSARAVAWVGLTPPAILPDTYGVWVVCGFLVFLIALRVFR
jgi:hypothetical protein